jgi:hypothetical protein
MASAVRLSHTPTHAVPLQLWLVWMSVIFVHADLTDP